MPTDVRRAPEGSPPPDLPRINLETLNTEQLSSLAQNLRRRGHDQMLAQLQQEIDRRSKASSFPPYARVVGPNEDTFGQSEKPAPPRRAYLAAAVGALSAGALAGLFLAVPQLLSPAPSQAPASGQLATRTAPSEPAPGLGSAATSPGAQARMDMLVKPSPTLRPQARRARGVIASELATAASPPVTARRSASGTTIQSTPETRLAIAPAPRVYPPDIPAPGSEIAAPSAETVERLDLASSRQALAASAPRRGRRCGLDAVGSRQLICQDADQVAQEQRFSQPFVTDVRSDVPRTVVRR